MLSHAAIKRITVGVNYLGVGLESTCYVIPNTAQVLIIERRGGVGADRYAYLEWCAKRLKVYGARSEQMAMLPEVFSMGYYQGRRWAVMARMPSLRERCTRNPSREAGRLVRVFQKLYPGVPCDDAHSSNWRWAAHRGQYVLADPITGDRGCSEGLLVTDPHAFSKKQGAQRVYLQ